MRTLRNIFLAGGALALLLTVAAAQTPLMRHTFDEGVGFWTGIGTNPRVTTEREGENRALRMDYGIAKGDLDALLLPTPEGALAKANSFRFRIKTDHTTPIVVALQEKGGGRYLAFFTAPKDHWQEVALAPSDFTLSEDANDPKDPNRRLDLDQVEGIAIADLTQLFAQIDNPEIAKLLNVKTGARTLSLDDFVVSAEALPAPSHPDFVVDTFSRPQVGWFAVGDARLSHAEGKPLEGRSLRVEYRQAPGKIIGFARRVPRGRMVGTGLRVTAASAQGTRLVVQLEEQGGGKYNATFELPADSAVREVSLPFAEFDPAEDSRDDNGKLDLEKVHQVLILDASGFFGTPERDNTLWIGKLLVKTEK